MFIILVLLVALIVCDSGYPDLEAKWEKQKCIIQGSCTMNNGTKICTVNFDIRHGTSDDCGDIKCHGYYSRVSVMREGKLDRMREYEIKYQCFSDEPYDQWIRNSGFYPGKEVDCYYDSEGSKTVYRNPEPDQNDRLTTILLISILPTMSPIIGFCLAICLIGLAICCVICCVIPCIACIVCVGGIIHLIMLKVNYYLD